MTVSPPSPQAKSPSWEPKVDLSTEPTDQYISNFSWNKIRYRADKPLGEMIDTLQKVRIRDQTGINHC